MSEVIAHPAVKQPKLNINRFESAEFKFTTWHVIPEAGVALESLLNPSFWGNVSGKLKALDHIIVNADDNAYYAELLVLSASKHEAIVTPICHVVIAQEAKAADETPEYEVNWGGQKAKFRIQRKSDRHVVKDGFTTKLEAEQALTEHHKALAA